MRKSVFLVLLLIGISGTILAHGGSIPEISGDAAGATLAVLAGAVVMTRRRRSK